MNKIFTTKDLYTAPPDHVFEAIKNAALQVWDKYDNTHNYVSKKKEKVKSLKNIRDNWTEIIGMFDQNNKAELRAILRTQKNKEAYELVNNLHKYERSEVMRMMGGHTFL